MDRERGILVIAQGKQRYIHMAKQIAISLAISNPGIPKALVTDAADPELENYYDQLIPIQPDWGSGYSQKLYMYEYSPFHKTMFIDADCLVIDDISWLFERFNGHAVSVIGRRVTEGPLMGTTLEVLKQKLNIEYLPTFNGGVYYYEKREEAAAVYAEAISVFYSRYDELELFKFNGKPGDEPAMAIAMAMHGMEPIDDGGRGMYTPVGQTGAFKMDVLKGFCQFYKYGKQVNPVIMHFGGGYPEAFHYRREIAKLKLAYSYRFPKKLASFIVNAVYNPSYAVYVFAYRIVKKIIKGGPLKLRPVLPMFKFE